VERVLVERLAQPDALASVLSGHDDTERHTAQAEVERLRAEMRDAQAALRAGRLSPLDMAAYREGWESRMAAAERDAQPPNLPDGLAEIIGTDAATRWAEAPIGTRRAVLDALMVTIVPLGRGNGGNKGFNPRAIRIDWK
jgi:hypothetical protein